MITRAFYHGEGPLRRSRKPGAMSYPVQPASGPPQIQYPPVPASASGMAVAAMILGLMSWVFGGLFAAIPAVILGKMELNAIDEGRSPASGRSFAQIGFWA